jgi:hypothetical protein
MKAYCWESGAWQKKKKEERERGEEEEEEEEEEERRGWGAKLFFSKRSCYFCLLKTVVAYLKSKLLVSILVNK